MVGWMASRLALVTGPKIASTLSRWISSRVRSTAVFGSVLSSATSTSNLRPRTPPPSLASSMASRVPSTPCCPRFSSPPDSGWSTPTLIGSAARAMSGAPRLSAAAPAALCNSRRRPMASARNVVLDGRAVLERSDDLLAVGHGPEVSRDVVQRRLLLARPRGGDAILGHDHLVPEEERVVHRRAHADVRHHPEDHDGVDAKVAQRQMQVGVEEGRVAPLDDVDILGPGVQIVDHLRTPRSLHAVGCPLQPFAILAHVASVGIHDEQDGTAAPASRVDDPPLGRDEPLVAGQDHGATWLAELVQHVDDDNRARPRLDAHRLLDLSRREDVHCHGNPPAARQPGLFIIHYSLFIIHYSLFIIHYSWLGER